MCLLALSRVLQAHHPYTHPNSLAPALLLSSAWVPAF
jgi:hypothetical protein